MLRRVEPLLFLVLLGALWNCRSALVPGVPRRVPDPLALPTGAPPLNQREAAAARRAVAAAERGDFVTARALAVELPAGHPARALVELEIRMLGGEAVFAPSLELARTHPEWATGWTMAALAGRRSGDLLGALGAARRAAELDSRGAARELAAELEREVVADAVSEGQALLARGDATDALAAAEAALEAVPDSSEARMLAATAALAAGRHDRAAALLPALPDTPGGLALKGKVAEALGQWDLAVDFFARLPADHPGRCALLVEARQRLRLTNAPPYVTRALESEALTRRGLAALVVWEMPAVTALARGPVPVFEDIVDAPERTDIVTVARAGVLTGDAMARRFGAGRAVSPRDLTTAVERLAAALGKPAPVWCDEGVAAGTAGCLPRPTRVAGAEVAELLRAVADGGGGECR